MTFSEKIKRINHKIEQDKAQYHLDRQIAKVLALSSGKFCKYEFLTGEDVLPEKDLLKKAATIKRFEYSPLGSMLKKHTGIAKDQYKLLQDQKNSINNNKEDGDTGKGYMSDKSNVAKKFDVILDDIKNNKKFTELISVKRCGKKMLFYIRW